MRRSHPSVADLLFEEPYRFDFFQAVRLLDRLRAGVPVGHDGPPRREVVRFAGRPSLKFPPSTIVDLEILEPGPGRPEPLPPPEPPAPAAPPAPAPPVPAPPAATAPEAAAVEPTDETGDWEPVVESEPGPDASSGTEPPVPAELQSPVPAPPAVVPVAIPPPKPTLGQIGAASPFPPRMTTAFMGLIGAAGALPNVYNEALIGPEGRKRVGAVAFFDLFHHRLVSLFYRAWEKYHLPALWERSRRPGPDGSPPQIDPFTRRLVDFVGLGLDAVHGRLAVPDLSLVFYGGLLEQQHRSAIGLERLLSDYFDRPIAVQCFVGRWLALQPEQRTRIGRRNGSFGRLGRDAVAGRRVWDEQGKFRVRVGPLSFAAFRAFLPDGDSSDPLVDLVRFYARGEFDFDVQLVLEADEVPHCQLTRDRDRAARLRRYSWLKRRPFERDADQAVFKPQR